MKVGTKSNTLFQPEKDTENANSYIVAVPVNASTTKNYGIFLVLENYEGKETLEILTNNDKAVSLRYDKASDSETLSVNDLKSGIYLPDFSLARNGKGAAFKIKLAGTTYKINVKRLFTPTVKVGADADTQTALSEGENGVYSFKLTKTADSIQLTAQVGTYMTAKYADVRINNKGINLVKPNKFTQGLRLSELNVQNGTVDIPIEIKANSAYAAQTKDLLTTKYYVKVKLDFDHIAFSHDADGTESYQLSPLFSTECKDYTLTVPSTDERIYVRDVSSENYQMKAEYSNKEVSVPNNYKYTELSQCISKGDSGEKITFQIGTESYNITIVRKLTLNNLDVKAGDKTLCLDRTFSKGVNQYYAFVPETAASVSIIGNYDANAYKFFVGGEERVNGSAEYPINWGEDNKKTLELKIQSIQNQERSSSYQLTLVKGDSDTPFIVEETNFEKTKYTKTEIQQKKTKQIEITAVVPNGGSLSYQWERLYDGWAAQEYIQLKLQARQ